MKKENSDFVRFVNEHGGAHDISEAFKEYPVEEEWHKGKIDNVIKETSVIYGDTCEIGDIVFVRKYYYEDGTEGENHFFVIIDVNNIAVPTENFGMIISSNLNKLTYNSNVLLKKDKKNNLKNDSIVKTDVVYKLLAKNIVFKIGVVDINKVNEYKRMYYNNYPQ